MIPRSVTIRGREIPTVVLVSFLAYLIGLLAHCLVMNANIISPDEVQADYFPAVDAMFNGHTPYHAYNSLAWEYPPLALIVLFIPRLFASTAFGYQWAFDVEMMLLSMLETWLIYLIAKRYGKHVDLILLLNMVLMCMMVINGSIYERFDVVPAVICVAAVWLFLEKKYPWAFALLAVGTLVKIYPILLFPAFIIPFMADRDWKSVGKYILVSVITGLAILAVFYLWCGPELMNFITYHSSRGLQIESTAASFISMLWLAGFTEVTSVMSFGSCNIEGPIANAVEPFVMPILVIVILIACYIQFLCSCRDEDRERNVMFFSFLYVLLFVILNKVFSGQYVMWIVPMFVIMLIATEADDDSWTGTGIMFSFTMMTMAIMALPLKKMGAGPLILLFVRNVFVIALLVWSLRRTKILDTAKGSFKEGNRLLFRKKSSEAQS